MGLEIEAKIKVDSHEAVRGRLKELGATHIGTALENNRIFDDKKKKLRKAGCGLRVRQIEVLHGDPGEPTMTYKGPRQRAELKVRSEINVALDDADQAAAILQALGYEPFITFEKKRESWQLGNCRVELDELPLLGKFVEIEGPDEQTVNQAKSDLGFSAAKNITQSYVKMLSAVCESSGIKSDFIHF